ncbi:hypothetical protein [Pseudoduganella armeniaca]|uniref:Uncharacterized protein n=1 Tax=Pseudoduganella armeniaca TaxID=2072590 RepID=A0A2R4CFV4_9BURK|nr:hypothetical protein [Pseudoduganella armeniaca]AVR98537.1 hypothetical protein C9I28_25065 [Pseudoduganella armeniaca]
MKKLLPIAFAFCSASASCADTPLLERALSCQLKDNQLASLMHDLAAQQPAFAKPTSQYGAPSADVYQLSEPVTALGYTAAEVVITPARILLAVPGKAVSDAAGRLKLKEEAYSPASRVIRPTVRIVAFNLSHEKLQGKLLVGCEYASSGAARWVH